MLWRACDIVPAGCRSGAPWKIIARVEPQHGGRIDRISSSTAYVNPWMTVREDQVQLPDGSISVYGVVDKPDYALVIPIDDDGMWLVQQYRYTVGRRVWEFPQGGWAPGAGGDLPDLARLELAEETGLSAGHLRSLGRLFGAYGYSSQGFDAFVATDLRQGSPAREHTEQDMVHHLFSDDEVRRMIQEGAIIDACSVAAYLLLALHGPTPLPSL
jgi:8-oxo-dGTP pyrophosphatase MutT (NUDIX family)